MKSQPLFFKRWLVLAALCGLVSVASAQSLLTLVRSDSTGTPGSSANWDWSKQWRNDNPFDVKLSYHFKDEYSDGSGYDEWDAEQIVTPGSYFEEWAFHEENGDVTHSGEQTMNNEWGVAPTFLTGNAIGAAEGEPITYRLQADQGTFLYSATDLPPGVVLNPITGQLSGQIAYAGTYISVFSATNGAGTTRMYVTWTITRAVNDRNAPTTPGNVRATNVGYTSFTVSWTPSTDNISVAYYDIYKDGVFLKLVSGANQQVPPATTTITGVPIASSCVITVRAGDTANNTSAFSTPITVTTLADTFPPTIPSGFSATGISASGLTVSWAAATDNFGVANYEVRRDGVSLGTVTQPTITVSGLTACTTYGFSVRARDIYGNWSEWSPAWAVATTSSAALTLIAEDTWDDENGNYGYRRTYQNTGTAPIRVTFGTRVEHSDGVNNTQTTTTQTLQPGQTLDEYDYRETTSDGEYWTDYDQGLYSQEAIGIPVVTGSLSVLLGRGQPMSYAIGSINGATSFTATPLPPGLSLNGTTGVISGTPTTNGTYTTPVTASNSYGVGRATVVWTVVLDTTPPTTPTALAVSGFDGPNFKLSWGPSADDVSLGTYEVEQNGAIFATTTEPTVTFSPTVANAVYIYRVRAVDRFNNRSAWSAPLSVETQSLAVQGGTVSSLVGFAGGRQQVTAATPPLGQYFSGWTVTGAGFVDNQLAKTATFTFAGGNATVKANFVSGYALLAGGGTIATANGGQPGLPITVTAPPAPAGTRFCGWVYWGLGYVVDAYATSTNVILGAGNAAIYPSFVSNSIPVPKAVIGSGPDADVGQVFTVTSLSVCYSAEITGQMIEHSTNGGLTWVQDSFWTGSAPLNNSVSQKALTRSLSFSQPGIVLFRTFALNSWGASVYGYSRTAISVPGALSWTPSNFRIQSFDTATYPDGSPNITAHVQWDMPPGAPTLAFEIDVQSSIGSGVIGTGVTTPTANIGIQPGVSYVFRVRSRNYADTSAWSNSLSIAVQPPVITQQPSSTTIGVGGTVTLRVTASGTAPLTYQWKKDGVAIAGATGAQCVISNAQLSHAGAYVCVVTGPFGAVTSSSATLTVAAAPPPPVINSGSSASVAVGSAFSYQITASGSPTSYNASGLPTGLAVSTSTGTITGTPTVVGTFSVTLSATNSAGTGTATLTLTITASGVSLRVYRPER